MAWPPTEAHDTEAATAAPDSHAALLDTAARAAAAGLSVMPIAADGSKVPVGRTWTERQRVALTPDEIPARFPAGCGVGIVCGTVSGGLECLDCDTHEAWGELLQECIADSPEAGELIARVATGYLEETPRGMHLWYRCPEISGNTVLARGAEVQPPARVPAATIETRGEGGYAIAAPSGGRVHPSGKPYRVVSGGPESILTISPEERALLHRVARQLTRWDEPVRAAPPPPNPTPPPRGDQDLLPGDLINRHCSWSDILDGWAFVRTDREGTSYWRRPGKDVGVGDSVSASTNYGGSDRLCVFSTSTPFELARLGGADGRSYDKFGAWALIHYEGDLYRAAQAAAAFFSVETTEDVAARIVAAAVAREADRASEERREALGDVVHYREIDRMPTTPPESIKRIAPASGMAFLLGPPNSGKTFLALEWGASIATGRDFLGHRVRTPGLVVYIAAEGSGGIVSRIWSMRREHLQQYGADLPIVVVRRAAGPSQELVEQIREWEAEYSMPCRLVVGDTLAQITGGDENSGADMAPLVQATAELVRELGCLWLWLAHPPKADGGKRTVRGWGGLDGSSDVTLRMERVGGISDPRRKFTIEKYRDGEVGLEVGLLLRTVELGVDEDGDPITSCVVEACELPAPGEANVDGLKPRARKVLGWTHEVPARRLPAELSGVVTQGWLVDDLREHAQTTDPDYGSADMDIHAKARGRIGEAVRLGVKALADSGEWVSKSGWIYATPECSGDDDTW